VAYGEQDLNQQNTNYAEASEIIYLLTFEEITTILAQIKAVLNSRPEMVVVSEHPDNLEVITPSHFLTGRPLTAPPEPILYDELTINCLRRI